MNERGRETGRQNPPAQTCAKIATFPTISPQNTVSKLLYAALTVVLRFSRILAKISEGCFRIKKWRVLRSVFSTGGPQVINRADFFVEWVGGDVAGHNGWLHATRRTRAEGGRVGEGGEWAWVGAWVGA